MSCLFYHGGKGLGKTAKVNFKTYDVIDWETNNYKTHIAKYLKKQANQTMEYGQLQEKYFFLERYAQNVVGKLVPDPSLKN